MVATEDATNVRGRNALLGDELSKRYAGVNEAALPASAEYISVEIHEANVGKATNLVGVVWWFNHFSISFLSTIMSR